MATPVPGRRWAKTDGTQQRILDAATDVSATSGFTAATIAEVVERSGASIGSIDHHFGGKSELFLAIFERMADAVDRRVEAAIRHAADYDSAGLDAGGNFELHVRAYLEAVWENRRLARVLSSGDTPAGFETTRRSRMTAAFHSWMSVLELDSSLRGRLLSRLLVATMAESSLMVAACDDPDDVSPIVDATIEWIGRLIE